MPAIDFGPNPSLNEIVSSLAARVDKPFDVGLQEELKHIVNYKRNRFVHEWLSQSPDMWFHFLQSFVVNTERAPATECEEFPTSCYIVRTVCQLPEPLRAGNLKFNWQLFEFVGTASGYRSYQFWQPEFIELLAHNPYTSKRKKWFWKNSRIYVILEKDDPPPPIQVRGIFENALDLQSCDVCSPGTDECPNDDDPYPVPPELLDMIVRDILATELRVGPLPTDTKMEQDDANVDTQERTQHVNEQL